MQKNVIYILKENEKILLGNINKWQETYFLLCFVTSFI
jgi:hypothetical protein